MTSGKLGKLLDTFEPDRIIFLLIFFSSSLAGGLVSGLVSWIFDAFIPLAFLGIWFSVWGIFLSIAGMMANKS